MSFWGNGTGVPRVRACRSSLRGEPRRVSPGGGRGLVCANPPGFPRPWGDLDVFTAFVLQLSEQEKRGGARRGQEQ